MTLKTLAAVKFSSAIWVINTPQFQTLYTVPAGKSALLKEIICTPTKIVGGSPQRVHIYVLKSGGVDIGAAAVAAGTFSALDSAVASPGTDTFPQTVDTGILVVGPVVLARTTILSTGDAIRLVGWDAVADAADSMRVKTVVSGDEF